VAIARALVNKTSIILADEYWKFRQQNPLEIMKLLETSMPTDTVILVTHEEEMPLMPTESFVCATDSLKRYNQIIFFQLIRLSAKTSAKRLHVLKDFLLSARNPLIIAFTIIIQYLIK
jgi:ABC-type lipoprotein export system ATPase subunit